MWKGKVYTSKPPPVACHDICFAKSRGGLCIRECQLWNATAIGKYVWQITKKADLMWIKWVHSVYIKDSKTPSGGTTKLL